MSPFGLKYVWTKFWASDPINIAIVCGKAKSELAKITGITPDWLTFIGIWELCPPYVFLPTTLLAYCTGIFLVASCIYVTAIIVRSITTTNITAAHIASLPFCTLLIALIISIGTLEIIPTNIIIELPLPKPFSVILSPIHINNILADTNVKIIVEIKNILSVLRALKPLIIPNVIPIACTRASANAVYLVYLLIFFLPSSPDFWSSSRLSKPIVRSCKMIDAVIYGPIPNANSVKLLNAPPVNILYRESRLLLPTISFIILVSTPGTGIVAPILNTTIIIKVYNIFFLTSLIFQACFNCDSTLIHPACSGLELAV